MTYESFQHPLSKATPVTTPHTGWLIAAPPILASPICFSLNVTSRSLNVILAQFHHLRNTQPPNCVGSIPSYHVFSLYVLDGWSLPNGDSSLKENL
jgi:hypothetical protein